VTDRARTPRAHAAPHWDACVGAVLVVLALVLLPFAQRQYTPLAGLFPALMLIGGLAELATAVLLFARYRRAPRRSLGFLGVAFVGLSLLSMTMTLAFPLGLHGEVLLPGGLSDMSWLYPGWTLCATLAMFVYFALERAGDRRPPSPAFLSVVVVGVALVGAVLCLGLVAAENAAATTRLALGPPYGPPLPLAVLLALAFLGLALRGPLQGLDAWLRLALLAIVLDTTVNTLSLHPYQLSWYLGRSFYVLTSMLVLAGAVRDLLAWEDRAVQAEADVERESGIVRRHARRLETLWRVASTSAIEDASYLRALLGAASTVLQEGHAFFASIQHLEGVDFVVDVSLGSPGSRLLLQPGARHPAAEMLAGQLLRAGPTTSWVDVLVDPVLAATRGARKHGIRAFVGTIFKVGPTVYALSLASPIPLEAPLDSLDHAFVETLAALCATRLQQRAQFDRLVYQTEHDTLTAVLTRAAFRARGAAALQTGEPFALVILDINGFRAVNESLGQQSGDALLVEVAAMLQSVADGDIVARLGADHFALLMQGVAGPAEAGHALARYQHGFDEPFTTGIFQGVQQVRLSATYGIALAPADGTHVDDLLAHANRALDAAQGKRTRAVAAESNGRPPHAA
jgi:diguanylate cyclase (GGDEF)-like protein